MSGSEAPEAMSVRTAAAWALSSQYGTFALQFATSVILARWLISPHELGRFSITFAAITLIAFLQDFGINRYVTGERDLTQAKLRTAFSLSLALAWTIALLCIAAAWPIARFFSDPSLLPIALVIGASYFCVPLAIVPQALCQRRMDYRSNTMIEIGAGLANSLVSIGLALRGHGALALAWGAFAQQAARMLVSQWRVGGMVPWPPRFAGAAPLYSIGATNTAQASCNTLAARAPELVIGHALDAASVGLYARASGLALQLRQLLSGAVSGVFYPAFRQVRDSGAPLGPPYLRVVAAYTGITWPAMAGIAVLAQPLIAFLYGERWLAAAPLLVWLALAQICYVALPLNYDLPILLGRMGSSVRRLIAETALALGLLMLAAPHGLAWIAAVQLVHGVTWLALWAPFMRALVGFDWGELLRVYARSALATLAAIAPVLAGYRLWEGPQTAGLGQMLILTLAGIAAWFAAMRITGHPLAEEIVRPARRIFARGGNRRTADRTR